MKYSGKSYAGSKQDYYALICFYQFTNSKNNSTEQKQSNQLTDNKRYNNNNKRNHQIENIRHND